MGALFLKHGLEGPGALSMFVLRHYQNHMQATVYFIAVYKVITMLARKKTRETYFLGNWIHIVNI